MVSPTLPVDPARNETPDLSCPMVGANFRGIVESSLDRGAIELGRERGFGDVGCSCSEMDTSLPSFGSHDGGVILRAAINYDMGNIAELQWDLAETEVLVEITG